MTTLHLDIDGVINVDNPNDAEQGIARSNGYRYRIQWKPAIIKALSELDLDLSWTTTWRDEAKTAIAPLIGWGQDGYVTHPQLDPNAATTFPSIDWKFDAMKMAYPDEHHLGFVWIDDELDSSHVSWAAMVGGLALPVRPFNGITEAEIEAIKSYIASRPEPARRHTSTSDATSSHSVAEV